MSHFEIVRTNAGHHARLEGDNNEAVWTTEVYGERKAAEDAITFLCRTLVPNYGIVFNDGHVTLNLDPDPFGDKLSLPVRLVDKRGEGL